MVVGIITEVNTLEKIYVNHEQFIQTSQYNVAEQKVAEENVY